MKTRNLILITNHYPHGRAESFVDYEIPYLQQHFDKVIVLSKNTNADTFRNYTFKNYRINPTSTLAEIVGALLQMTLHFPTLINYLINEYRNLRANKKSVSIIKFRIAIHEMIKAFTIAYHIKRIIRKENMKGTLLLYSYWLNNSALATTLVKSSANLKVSTIARAHGGDVYEERNANNYLSFRETIVSRLSFVFPISTHAMNHLRIQLPEHIHHKLIVQRLGTPAPMSNSVKKNDASFTLVSCSFMISVKRIELIVEMLALIKDQPIQWIHLGGGPLFTEIETKAKAIASQNPLLAITFKGTLSSIEIQTFYASHYIDLFINTSSYEGIPVSMMEAQSFGIPILGINTGGVSEIVNDSVGILVEQNETSPTVLAGHVLKFIAMRPNQIKTMREAARKSWETQYQATENFSNFAHLLSTL